jgi:predicted dehydrogenase
MKALVIGAGSIGLRHIRLLQQLACDVAVVTQQTLVGIQTYSTVAEALAAQLVDYCVIANATHLHITTLQQLYDANFMGKVLVEKPLFNHNAILADHAFQLLCVGYNLRFHPILQAIKSHIMGEAILMVSVQTGQYLPTWREGDHHASYSAIKAQGGGVLRDLSHEIDYITWLFGDIQGVFAKGGRVAQLTQDSEDAFSVIMCTSRCPIVTMQVDYLSRVPMRHVTIQTEAHTIQANLIDNILSVNGKQEAYEVNKDETYLAEHQAMIDGKTGVLCSAPDAQRVMHIIEQIEQSNQQQQWIKI